MRNADSRVKAALIPAIVGACLMVGCASIASRSPLPQFPALPGEHSLTIIADRQASIQTLSAQCEIVLTDKGGQRVKLDGVLLAMPASAGGPRVRLRAWKLGQAVFDLTLVNGSAWLMAPDDVPTGARADPQSETRPNASSPTAVPAQPARQIAEALDFLGPDYFRGAVIREATPTLLIASAAPSRLDQATCEITRSTLTPRAFVVDDLHGASVLSLSDYRLVGAIPWAHTLSLVGPRGVIDVRMSEVEINGELPLSAFVPPARARQLR